MLFNSLEFLVFFVVVLGLYSVLNHPRQNALLLVASYVFYGAWDYRFLLLLIGTTLVDYAVALAIDRRSDPAARRRILMFSIVANLGVLGIFKYFNFFADSLVDFAGLFRPQRVTGHAQHRAARGHFLLYVPVDGLHHRRVPRDSSSPVESCGTSRCT